MSTKSHPQSKSRRMKSMLNSQEFKIDELVGMIATQNAQRKEERELAALENQADGDLGSLSSYMEKLSIGGMTDGFSSPESEAESNEENNQIQENEELDFDLDKFLRFVLKVENFHCQANNTLIWGLTQDCSKKH